MDVSLLSKMIFQLILDRDEVALPGMGVFVAEMIPASFSDKGYTINPPYRRLSFYSWKSDDKSLVELYAKSNGISIDRAESYISAFVREIKNVLLQRRSVVFPGLGKLRVTRDDKFFFVGDEELDIFPDGVGLQPVSLKNNNLETDGGWNVPEFTAAPVVGQGQAATAVKSAAAEEPDAAEGSGIAEKPVVEGTAAVEKTAATEEPGTAVEEISAEDVPLESSNDKVDVKVSRSGRKFLKLVLGLVIFCAIALAAFLLAARYAPDFVDSLLYTKEELEILRW